MGVSAIPPDRPLIVWEPSATPPAGYIKANGALLSRSVYAWLFERIGTTFGAGDGSTTFATPDLRAEILRGLDDGRGVDVGRVLGSAQGGMVGSHDHGLGSESVVVGTGGGASANLTAGGGTRYYRTADPMTGNVETRMRNVAGLYCIAYAP